MIIKIILSDKNMQWNHLSNGSPSTCTAAFLPETRGGRLNGAVGRSSAIYSSSKYTFTFRITCATVPVTAVSVSRFCLPAAVELRDWERASPELNVSGKPVEDVAEAEADSNMKTMMVDRQPMNRLSAFSSIRRLPPEIYTTIFAWKAAYTSTQTYNSCWSLYTEVHYVYTNWETQ